MAPTTSRSVGSRPSTRSPTWHPTPGSSPSTSPGAAACRSTSSTTTSRRFHGQVLPFDYDAAFAYTDVVDGRIRNGRPIGEVDAQIASICRARSVPLATRNTKDFELTGVELIDPWVVDPSR
jgi:hypothetical protein